MLCKCFPPKRLLAKIGHALKTDSNPIFVHECHRLSPTPQKDPVSIPAIFSTSCPVTFLRASHILFRNKHVNCERRDVSLRILEKGSR